MKNISLQFFLSNITTDIPFDEVVDEIGDFDERFSIILKKHLAVLGWWCFLNLLTGIPGMIYFQGAWWYFFMMNICWAVINFAIVLFLFDHVFFLRFQKGSIYQRFEVQRHVQRLLLFNIGLDAAYVFAGLYLKTLSFVPDISYAELWYGFGWSVILQGVFLFVHDNVFQWLHLKNFRQCKPFLEKAIKDKLSDHPEKEAISPRNFSGRYE